ncbi:MAG: KpsF/GutQ family sugar-phosphate isomerase [Rikenellaceae bacterium]|jgi:arabinose-5-phosphate isomerase|nr:KpsF/GutQ family sugar-phosphate isomerase [Rikenellaceae bacterium]
MDEQTKKQVLTLARKTLHSEAEALTDIASRLDDNFVGAVETIFSGTGKLIVTGLGKSGLVGRKIAATLSSTGTPSYYIHPTEAFHGDLGMIAPGDVVLAISNSGETDEILRLVPFFRENSNALVSMTGNASSTLARVSDFHIDVRVASEACVLHVAPTTSTTAQMSVGDAIAVVLTKLHNFQSVDYARFHPGGTLGRRLVVKVGGVMRSDNLPVVAPETGTIEMIHQMSAGRLGLVVVKGSGGIEGIVTDGDVRRAMDSRRHDFFNLTALDIASRRPKTISPDALLTEAERVMTDNKITSLLVTDPTGNLVGIIQIYDIKI